MSWIETPLKEVVPGFMVALGNEAMVRVWRDPLFIPDCWEYDRVKRFIAAHGLVLAETEEVDDDKMMSGRCFADMYMTADMRRSYLTKDNDD